MTLLLRDLRREKRKRFIQTLHAHAEAAKNTRSATERTGKYTPIARLTQEQNASDYNSQMYAGTLELIHYLPVGSTYEDVLAGQAEENTVLYDVLNAIGYATRDPFDKDYSQYDINYSMSNLNRQLRAWIGYVKNDGNNVAQYVEQKQYDDDNKAPHQCLHGAVF